MAKTSDPEKKCENAPPDGVVKEGPEETAHGWPCLISLKRSSPWEEKESQKDSPGLKEKSEEIAASEQNTSKGKDRSLLPCSNKKRKTCTTRLAGIEPKYMWMPLLIPVLFSIFIPGANGLKVYREEGKFRKVFIATNETQIVTDPIEEGPNVGSLFAVFADGGNDRKISFKVDSDFVIDNQSCNIEVGNKNQTECEGLQILRNGTHIYLAVNGSKLTRDRTEFYIYQQVPQHFSLYVVDVYINYDQAPDRTNTRNRNLVIFLSVVTAVLAILCVTFATLYCLQRRSKGKSKEQVSPVILTDMKPIFAFKDDL